MYVSEDRMSLTYLVGKSKLKWSVFNVLTVVFEHNERIDSMISSVNTLLGMDLSSFDSILTFATLRTNCTKILSQDVRLKRYLEKNSKALATQT